MNEDVGFIKRYQARGALFDANLLLVYLVGKGGRNRLLASRHTQQYADDFPLLEKLVEYFAKLYTTPHVLTEVSNLGGKIGPEFFDRFRAVIQVLDERSCTSRDASLNPRFSKLGLTDAALLHLGPQFLVVTTDFNLHGSLRANEVDAVNFHNLRLSSWVTAVR